MSTNPSPTILTNTENDLKYRLLKAMSVNNLNTAFTFPDDIKGTSNRINYITNTLTSSQINQIFFNHFSLLRQHIYLYNFRGTLNENWLDEHPAFVSKNGNIINLLFKTSFTFINGVNGGIESLDFLQPVQVDRKGTILIIKINILERDIEALIKTKIYGKKRDITEEQILSEILNINSGVTFNKADVNRGIKKLWDDDSIDAFKVMHKKSKSVSIDTMDEDNLYKKEYPTEYLEVIKNPLNKSYFMYLDDDKIVNRFITNPTEGTFSYTTYPTVTNGLNTFIDLVLTNN